MVLNMRKLPKLTLNSLLNTAIVINRNSAADVYMATNNIQSSNVTIKK